ncbi:hypothetical protein F2Q69_00043483 [Brassica cretica]|uniref:Uncharacterized protein n=1 Tax=Brassica cretica TaxID=69181 RepID=A0A8S9NI75_BRACR|nr:hypothetical protein F2Q69_00043483 [Brassica cretica]
MRWRATSRGRSSEVALRGSLRSDVIRATQLSHSHFDLRSSRVALGARESLSELESRSRSDISQRPHEVARVFCDWERRLAATTRGRSRAGPGKYLFDFVRFNSS